MSSFISPVFKLLFSVLLCLIISSGFTSYVFASGANDAGIERDDEQRRIYRNPAERREAGLENQLTEWLSFSGLLEIEKEKTRQHYRQNVGVSTEEPTTSTLQLAFRSEFEGWLEAEVVFESEYSRHLHDGSDNYHHSAHSRIDEAEFSVDFDVIAIKFGRINVPFGEYNSYFVTGPLLEYGETRRDSMMLEYAFNDEAEVTVFIFDSKVGKLNNESKLDLGASFEFKTKDETVVLGMSYISDLAESDELFLEDFNNTYQQRVAAWSAYLLAGYDKFELSLETVRALDEFVELDSESNKPAATNLEIVCFAVPDFLIAARIEHSKEFEEAPEWQYGLTVTWLTKSRFVLSADYLYGDFKNNFVEDDDGNVLSHHHQIAARLSVEL